MPKQSTTKMFQVLTDDNLPLEHRVMMLRQVSLEADDANLELLATLLTTAANKGDAEIYKAQVQEMNAKLQQLEQGPLRTGTFRRMLEGNSPCPRAGVVLEDGNSALVTVPDESLAKSLRRGDTVVVDVKGNAVLFRDEHCPETGELARFERKLDGDRVEVMLRNHERSIVWTTAGLADRIEAAEIEVGRMLIVCPRRRMAFDALPAEEGLEHYVYLARERVPQLKLAEIGAPPGYIEELIELVRLEMTDPQLRRRYNLQSCAMKVLAGPSGTGKSYSIYALWHELYRTMSEVTGVPIDELPPRVIRLRMSEVLSHWLGDSDKNLDRFFEECEQLAGDPFVAADGKTYTLPALCILEEIDGLARSRGQDPIYDRILTTALQRLDTSRPELQGKLILFIATTNVPEQVDAAFLRRVAGTMERFGRLRRAEFASVLEKQLADRPVALTNGVGRDGARSRLISAVTASLYGPAHADTVQVELSYAGSANWDSRYRRDFLTASVVDRAMQFASSTASVAEHRGEVEAPGLTAELLLTALHLQVRGIVDSLHESNVKDYLDLPEGARVASLRRPHTPSIQPVSLETIN